MLEINNFNIIKELISFNSDDEFYFLQIIKRKKENPEQTGNSRIIKTYYITGLDYFESKYEEIKTLSKLNNARAYINLNKRSFEKIAFHNLKKITDCIMNKDYKSIKNSYDSVCGQFSIGDKFWIIDIDLPQVSPRLLAYIEYECDPITVVQFDEVGFPISSNSKIISIIPTLNGHHIITKPFRIDQFKCKYPELDIQKNNPTLLYYGRN